MIVFSDVSVISFEILLANFCLKTLGARRVLNSLSKPHNWSQKYGPSSQVVVGDRFNCTELETFYKEYVVLQDRWLLMAVASQDRFHCIEKSLKLFIKSC